MQRKSRDIGEEDMYKFLRQFTQSKPDSIYPFDDYPNGFIFLVIFALVIFLVGIFTKML